MIWPQRKGPHRYTLFVLSDTRDDAIAAQEWQAFGELRAQHPQASPCITAAAATTPTKRVGNIAEWITRLGRGI